MAAGKKLGDAYIEVTADASKVSRELGPEAERALDDAARKMGDTLDKGLTDATERGTSGLGDAVSKETEKATDRIGGKFSESLNKQLVASFAALPAVKVGADATSADRTIAGIRQQLAELTYTRVGVDVSTGDALAQVGRLRADLDELSRSSSDVSVRVDTAVASAELKRFETEVRRLDGESPTVKPDVDVSFGAALSNASSVGEGALQGLMATAWALAPALLSIGATAVGGIGAIGPLAAGAAAGLAVLVAGVSGVSGAITLLTQRNDTMATTAKTLAANSVSSSSAIAQAEAGLANTRASNADAAISAAQRVASATREQHDAMAAAARNTAAAEYSAATSIAGAVLTQQSAERSLAAVLRDQKTAQLDLIAARLAAQRQLEDYSNQVADNSLSQRQAITDVSEAQRELNAVLDNTRSSSLARAAAQLNYDTQIQKQKELAQAGQRLAADQALAASRGVDGNLSVVSATQKVADAATDVQLAQAAAVKAQQELDHTRMIGAQDVALAYYNANKSIFDSNQGVADALRAQTAQARNAAFSVASAQAGISSAMRAAGGNAAASLAGVNTQLDKLDPATRAFAEYAVSTLVPAWNDIQGAAAAGALPGLQKAFEALMPLLPSLIDFVTRMSGVIGDLFADVATHLTDPAFTNFFNMIGSIAGPALKTAADAVWNLVEGFLNLMTAFAPLSVGVGGGIADLTKRFADWSAGLANNKGFQDFLGYVKDEWPHVAAILGNLADTIGGLIPPALAVGAAVLPVLQGITWAISQIPGPVLAGMIVLFLGLSASIKMASGINSFVEGMKGVGDASKAVWDGVSAVGKWIWSALESAAKWVWSAAVTVASWVATAAAATFNAAKVSAVWLAETAMTTGEVLLGWGIAVASVVGGWVLMGVQSLLQAARMAAAWLIAMGPVGIIIAVVVGLVALIIANWDTVKNFTIGVFTAIWDFIQYIWNAVWGFIQTVVGAIVTGVEWYFNLWWTVISTVLGAIWGVITTVWNAVWGFIVGIVGTIVGWVVGAWQGLVGGISAALHWVWDAISGVWNGIWGFIKDVVGGIVSWVVGAWKGLVDGIKSVFGGITDFVGGIFNGIGTSIKTALNWIIDGVNGTVIKGINVVIDGVNFVNPFGKIPHIGDIPHLADGAIVHRATLALVGEDGPEAVIPLSAARSGRRAALMDQAGLSGGDAGGSPITVDARQYYTVRDSQSAEEVGAVVGQRVVRDVRSGITGRYTQRTAA